MGVGNNIQRLRKERKLTQASLAKKANISEISIRKYESGDRAPKIETIQKIANALQVSVKDIFVSFEDGEPTIDIDIRGLDKGDIENYANAVWPVLNELTDYEKKRPIAETKTNKVKEMLIPFNKLNVLGQETAIERVTELTKIPEYCREQEPDSSDTPE